MNVQDESFDKVGQLLKKAKRILFITGAGVSAESGIPTFRGSTAAFENGLTDDGIPFEEALSASTFRERPQLSWKYFFQMELGFRGKKPNLAHLTMAAIEKTGRHVCVVTQNIDGLHQMAGSKCVIELHGDLRRLLCVDCDFRANPATFEGMAELPRCPKCNGILRPDVVLYEERLPEDALSEFYQEQAEGFDLVCSVGTTSIFPYITEPVFAAIQGGIPTVEINPELTAISHLVRFRFAAPAGATLEKLSRASV